jgi:hypothetical protein
MAEIEVHFTEYFDGEAAIGFLDGREVFRAEELKTDLRTGLARIVRVPMSNGPLTIGVELPSRGLKGEALADASDLKFVSVALDGEELKVVAVSNQEYSREPRGYA